MKRIDLVQTVSLLANIGVLAGLILVAIQIGQNTDIARAQLENDYYLADMELELAMMGDAPVDAWLKAVYTPAEITPGDAAVLDRYFNYGMVQLRRLDRLQQIGLADSDVLAQQVEYLGWHLGNEVGQRWWANYRNDEPDDPLVQRVDAAILAAAADQNRTFLDALLPGELED